MRVVLDTNVSISAFLWRGTPAQILALARDGAFQLCTTREMLDEFQAVLEYPKFAQRLELIEKTPVQVVDEYVAVSGTYSSIVFSQPQVPDDPSDDMFLACALASRADFIISGDKHLLKLKSFSGIPILTPSQFLNMFRRRR